ncbi:low-temperature-induced 65 kDa protein-like [Zingiber officinale]|uniref:low-temperature-induced 65 kDa protein-like n=1 Tax=Zingiber officinale TaxID=94328 RepID=UPI001C4CA27F|nr:low-temperature-induced 65 kDa protein-like [Zingiber officinale]
MDAQVAPMLGHAYDLEPERPAGLRAAIDGEEEAMRQEKKPVLKKVKEKVKKIKDTVKKKTHGHGNSHEEEDDDDEDDEEEDPEVHGGLKDTLETCAGEFQEDPAAPTSSEASRERTRDGEEIGMSPVIQSFMAMSVENPAPVKNSEEEKCASARVSARTKTAYEKVEGRLRGGVGVMLVEKLKPGEEDKALSEVISGVIQRRKTAAGETVAAASSGVKDGGVGVVGRLREAVASWAGGRRSSMSEHAEQQSKELEDENGRDRQS